MRGHTFQQQVKFVLGHDDAFMSRPDEAGFDHVALESEQAVEKAEGIEQPHRLGVIAKLRPAYRLPKLVHGADTARQGEESIGKQREGKLSLVHSRNHAKLAAFVVGDLAVDHRLGDHADDMAARRHGRFGKRTHQAQPPAAVDNVDPARGQCFAHFAGKLHIAWIGRRGRPAIDCDALHIRSPIISPAVALALPTTPGIPAPGWVPAPTR